MPERCPPKAEVRGSNPLGRASAVTCRIVRQSRSLSRIENIAPIDAARGLECRALTARDKPLVSRSIVAAKLQCDPTACRARPRNDTAGKRQARRARGGEVNELLVLPRHVCAFHLPV